MNSMPSQSNLYGVEEYRNSSYGQNRHNGLPLLVAHGANLNMLGQRDHQLYGHATLENINEECIRCAQSYQLHCDTYQTNNEGDLISLIHRAHGNIGGLIINPGAWSHTSLALADAVAILTVPIVEVHISNIYAREEYRQKSYISSVARGVISGLGTHGYILAVHALGHALTT